MKSSWIIVRGGGDLATGTIHRLWSCGFKVLVLETKMPAAIRRQVSVCEAVYDGEAVVEGMKAIRIFSWEQAEKIIESGAVPVLVDPEGASIDMLHPRVVIDAILAKRNLGTHREMAPLTIGLGPGFCAGKDVDVVIETKRGHDLGRVIYSGMAAPNTGIPGMVGGYAKERVLHAPVEGAFKGYAGIGDIVEAGAPVAAVIGNDGTATPLTAGFSGIVRGLLRDGYPVTKGFKVADIDPRKEELANCFTISDKARCIAGSVLEVVVREYIKNSEGFISVEKTPPL